MKFRKKPVVVEAIQYTGARTNAEAVFAWVEQRKPRNTEPPFRYTVTDDSAVAYIKTLEGPLNVSPGDWIIQGVGLEFYPCKPDIFVQTYEEVHDLPDEDVPFP